VVDDVSVDEQTRRERAKPWDLLAGRYDSLFTRPVDEAENRVVFAWVRRHLEVVEKRGLGARVLDLGCGPALLLDYLRPSGYVGVDISTEMLAKAAEKHPWRLFYQTPMEDLAVLNDRRFDLAVSLFGSISHADPATTLDGLIPYLNPGGKVLLLVYAPRYRKRRSACWRQVPEAGAAGSYIELPAEGWRSLVSARLPNVEVRGFRYLPDSFWKGRHTGQITTGLEAEVKALGDKVDGWVKPYWFMIEASR
jgi:SAM-dependent methyltransferase